MRGYFYFTAHGMICVGRAQRLAFPWPAHVSAKGRSPDVPHRKTTACEAHLCGAAEFGRVCFEAWRPPARARHLAHLACCHPHRRAAVLHLPGARRALQPPSQAQLRAPRAAAVEVEKRTTSPQPASWSCPASAGQDETEREVTTQHVPREAGRWQPLPTARYNFVHSPVAGLPPAPDPSTCHLQCRSAGISVMVHAGSGRAALWTSARASVLRAAAVRGRLTARPRASSITRKGQKLNINPFLDWNAEFRFAESRFSQPLYQ